MGDLDPPFVVPTDVGVYGLYELLNGCGQPIARIEQFGFQPTEEAFACRVIGRVPLLPCTECAETLPPGFAQVQLGLILQTSIKQGICRDLSPAATSAKSFERPTGFLSPARCDAYNGTEPLHTLPTHLGGPVSCARPPRRPSLGLAQRSTPGLDRKSGGLSCRHAADLSFVCRRHYMRQHATRSANA